MPGGSKPSASLPTLLKIDIKWTGQVTLNIIIWQYGFMVCSIICGAQYGDEGKGKIVAYIAHKDKPEYSVRGGVGPNAGHGVRYRGHEIECRHVPAGFVCESSELRLGSGSLVDPELLSREIKHLEELGFSVAHRFKVDRNCGVVERRHVEGERTDNYLHERIGSMASGCGKANAERALRTLNVANNIPELSSMVCDVSTEMNKALDEGKSIVIEGTQGFGLSLYHGAYPFVTSRDTAASTLAGDVGISPFKVDEIVLVMKPYITRAGMGPLAEGASEVPRIEEAEIRPGVAIGNRRRVGNFDWELVQRAVMVNRPTQIAITNIDRRWPEYSNLRNYEDLRGEARGFVEEIEGRLKTHVTIISTGPELEDIIDRRT